MKNFDYKIVTYDDGSILKADKAFVRDFPGVKSVREKIKFFGDKEFQLIKFTHYRGEQTFVCKAKALKNGTYELELGKLAKAVIEPETEAERSAATFEEEYFNLIKTEQQVLVGEIFFQNLHEIMLVFGRKFTERVREVLLARVSEKFRTCFHADYYHAKVLFWDAAAWQKFIRDLNETVEHFNRVVKIDDNLIKVRVKCGFAIVDRSMDFGNYEYVTSVVEGALKRAVESESDDVFERKDFYVYQEIQKKVYSKYLFKIDIPALIGNDDFYLEYQPQYDVRENRIVGFEALFRVKKSVQVNASVFEIISYAEQSGNMVKLGDFIFDT
ncbi:MAG: EAL domain-containing protein [Clostridia bacterium]|nr:EAL domain-containing protein [Clostridia bacterium]